MELVEIIGVKYYLKLYKSINFNEVFPGYNFDEILPQLQIGEDGYAKFDIEEVFSGFDYVPEHYKELNNNDISPYLVYKSNKNFDLEDIRMIIYNLNMAITEEEYFKKYGNISFESWEYEQFYKYINNLSDEIETESFSLEQNEDEFDYKIKNATMTFEINGKILSFQNVTN